jgi:SAM-dependent methyltransferase
MLLTCAPGRAEPLPLPAMLSRPPSGRRPARKSFDEVLQQALTHSESSRISEVQFNHSQYKVGNIPGDFTAMAEENGNPSPVALEQRRVSADQRMFSPSAARNSEPIRRVLRRVLPTHGVVLEIGCGTGEHTVCFAEAMPNLSWQPSDPDADARASTAAWIKFTGLNNVLAPLDIDVCSTLWGVEQKAPFDAIVSINMIHIAPWAASLGLFAGAGRLLGAGGLLVLYGPFMRDGVHNAPSNAAFDASLKARNPSWGVRDITDLERVAQASRLGVRETINMPANNILIVFSSGGA